MSPVEALHIDLDHTAVFRRLTLLSLHFMFYSLFEVLFLEVVFQNSVAPWVSGSTSSKPGPGLADLRRRPEEPVVAGGGGRGC